MQLERFSPCKVNLFLNILGKRPDGYHELETILHPVNVCDRLEFERGGGNEIELSCSDPSLPSGPDNLVYRAAERFFETARIRKGIFIRLEKRIPVAAGLGGGSSNAAHALLGLNELFEFPLGKDQVIEIAASLGSDVPFFLQSSPALALNRGERVIPVQGLAALEGVYVLLIHPGFGISTAWAYQELAKLPQALHGEPGRARKLITLLETTDLRTAGKAFYNSLEAPAFRKFPWLEVVQEFLREHGAAAALMSGSGSTTFALFESQDAAASIRDQIHSKFGEESWTAVVPL